MMLLKKLNQLDKQAWLLLTSGTLYALATALSNSFVYVFLWKLKYEFELIGWFNFTHYLVGSISFILSGWLVKKVDRVISIRLGLAILFLFYLFVLWLGSSSVHYVWVIGTLLGLGTGFFWQAYNVMYFEITERDNRDIFNGVNGLFYSITGIIGPILAGYIISQYHQFIGYRIIFGISLGIFSLLVLVSFLFKRRDISENYRLKDVFALVKDREDPWFWVSIAMFIQGLRDGVFTFLLSILVYITTENELTLGTFFTIASLVSSFSYYIVGRFLKPSNRSRFIFIGTIMIGMVTIPYTVNIFSTYAIFILGIGVSLFTPIFMSPVLSTVFDVIGENQRSASLRVEYVVSRELSLNVGRLLSLLLFIYWISLGEHIEQIRWFVLVVSFLQIFIWYAIKRIQIKI